jgi:hypothetical protein
MFWAICLYLALEFGAFVLVKLILRVSVGDLFGPYLAFAIPGISVLFLAKWLRDWEGRGPSPKQTAFAWAITMVLFFLAITAALFYSATNLRLINASDAVWVFGVMAVGGTTAGLFAGYNMALASVSARLKQTTSP